MSFQPRTVLFDKGVVRRVYEARVRFALRQPPTMQQAEAANVPAQVIGHTGGKQLRIAVAGQTTIDLSIEDAERVWRSAIERYFARRVA